MRYFSAFSDSLKVKTYFWMDVLCCCFFDLCDPLLVFFFKFSVSSFQFLVVSFQLSVFISSCLDFSFLFIT